jgi:hypothetical protein
LLGTITDQLAKIALLPGGKEKWVSVETPLGWLEVTDLHSYRGYYEDLAVTVAGTGAPWNLGKLLRELRAAQGKTFTGYKGGEYVMTRVTPVWVVLGYDRTSDLIITGARESGVGDRHVVLETEVL